MPTNRLEAFSDGVFAIAITLLVLDLRVPRDPTGGLGHALWFDLWPNYFAYVVSFVVIGIMWINHHAVIGAIGRADQTVLGLNLLLLMTVGALPFTTSLVAEYLRDGGGDARLAVAVYSLGMVLNAISWTLLWQYTVHRPRLLAAHVDPARAVASARGFNLGLPLYAATVGVSFVNAYAGLLCHLALALYYLRSPIRLGEPDPAG
jgi:uncharacterized membrane protein